jgi:hypothetical protein
LSDPNTPSSPTYGPRSKIFSELLYREPIVSEEMEEYYFCDEKINQAFQAHRPPKCAASQNMACPTCAAIFDDEYYVWRLLMVVTREPIEDICEST